MAFFFAGSGGWGEQIKNTTLSARYSKVKERANLGYARKTKLAADAQHCKMRMHKQNTERGDEEVGKNQIKQIHA